MKSFQLARRIHRTLVLFVVLSGLIMSITGMFMKFPILSSFMPFMNQIFVRSLHNALSSIFAMILILMMLTGGYMFVYPWIQQKWG
ncbi:hypothetical protein COV53_02950 [Candidatus Gottesmanbacteria bacterium CG11_big_fil_rev_8_21_14_0_20_37_11]|uniref:Cytochrome b561 bacterial/Ni-hydrogenase domain-containing protein n=1 Tax=Candidatus Gottesmanbacteria bacterium CG11_big_fil_rev_8_21_14_0_20_37_11 TaxID=1974575 RepID=A0A2H0NHU1_9BACT|nr:MAG: hypothetical protein COV53_02950 [Candidatus Gottesmanbacteria bacterium CG11_big_fil_rev_8_21_14_0_20_37_11]